MLLTQTQIDAFETEGYLSGIRVVDESTARRYQTLFNELEAREGRDKCQIQLLDRHFDQEFVWRIATNPIVLDCIRALLGPDVMLMATHFFCKYGPTDKFVAWHQDLTYWGLEPPIAISAWYAIDDSDCENGCMRVIPGTHRRGILTHGKSAKQGNLLSINQQALISEQEEQRAVDIVLKAGEISLHHGLLIHGSQPNASTRRRCGLTNVFIPANVKQVEKNSLGEYFRVVLVNGQSRQTNLSQQPAPFPFEVH